MTDNKPCADMTDTALQAELEDLELLMNERQIKFALAKERGESNRDAFKGANYNARNETSMDSAAANLLRSPKVSRWLSIRKEQAKRVSRITRESVITSMARLAKKAEDAEDYNAARQAYAEAAKLLDFYPASKSEIDIKDDRALAEALSTLDDDQKRALFRAKREQEEGRIHH